MDIGMPSVPGVTQLQKVGEGGSAAVYSGHQTTPGRPVAVKILTAPVTDTRARASFLDECEALAALQGGPNIIQVYEDGLLPDGRPYLVMQLCTETLDRLVSRKGRLAPAQAVQVAYQVAQALHHAHGNGRFHQDVKPANVLILPDNRPVLADFGALGGLSAGYAAPERLAGAPADVAGDLYGLGATLYFALSGKAPNPDRGNLSLDDYARLVAGQPAPTLPPDVPEPVVRTVQWMLARDSADRPRNAGEVMLTLTGLPTTVDPTTPPAYHPAGPPVSAPASMAVPVAVDRTEYRPIPESPVDPGQRDGHRPRWIVPVAAGAAVVVAGVIAVVALGGSGKQSTPPPAAAGPTSASPSAQPAVVLAEPVDNGTTITLTWTGSSTFQYAVSVAEAGGATQRKLVGAATTYQAQVKPGVQYCFQVVATGGRTATVSEVKGIRGAVCRF